MKKKKLAALLTAFCLICGIFANVPLAAAAPEEKIETVVEGNYNSIYLFDEALGIYSLRDENYLYGLFSSELGWLTECQWQYIYDFDENGFAQVAGQEGLGVISTSGELVIPAKWDMLRLDSGLAIVCSNGLYGLLDMQGGTVLEPSCSFIDDFHDGLAIAYKNGYAGFINSAGRFIAEPVYLDAQSFSQSLAAVKDKNGLWGFIGTDGSTVIPCKYDNAGSFSGGYAFVQEGEAMYAIDQTGNKVTNGSEALAFEPAENCLGYLETPVFYGSKKDVACVKLYSEEKYCYISSSFKVLTESVYTYNVNFTDSDYAVTLIPNSEGEEKYAVLKIDRTSGLAVKALLQNKNGIRDVTFNKSVFFDADSHLYNIDGLDLFDTDIDRYIYHYDDSDIINAVCDGRYIGVSFSGEVISNFSDYQLYYVTDSLFLKVADDGRVKFCDRSGKQIAETDEYADAYVDDGLIFVKNSEDKWGIMDTECNIILEPQFDELLGANEDMLKYKNNGKYGFVNLNTLKVIKAQYVNVSSFKEGYAWVTKDVLTGAIDKNGEWIIKPLYWAFEDDTGFGCNRFSNGVTSVQKDKFGNYGVINMSGQRLTNFSYDYIGPFTDDGIALFYSEDRETAGIMRLADNTSTETPTEITVENYNISTYVGCYSVINETVTPDTSSDLGVSYKSANTDVATVDEAGRVYGVAEGTTTVLITSNADSSVFSSVVVKVEDRTLHAAEDIIPEDAWEGQTWLSDAVIDILAAMGTEKTADTLTYGDLLEIKTICLPYIPDPGDDTVYFIPSIICEFSNLVSFKIGYNAEYSESSPVTDINSYYKHLNLYDIIYCDLGPDYNIETAISYTASGIFSPVITTMPDSAKYLSNLMITDFCGTYGDKYDENIIRANSSGIPDLALYKALSDDSNIVRKGDYVSPWLSLKGITDITGLSLLDFSHLYEYDGTINLSYNNISDISELAKISFLETVDLQYNMLDLEDENTLAVIAGLEENGCEVLYDGQNEPAVQFVYEDWYGDFYSEEPFDFEFTLSDNSSSFRMFIPHPDDFTEEISVASSNADVAIGYIEYYRDGVYELICEAKGTGEAYISLMYKGDILYKIPVSVTDPRFFAEDIEVSYSVYDWSPTRAYLNCYNNYSYLQYRLAGESAWQTYGDSITKNGTYEVRYCNQYGIFSNIATLEITEIKELITAEQMPDENLRNYFKNPYVGQEVTSFHAICNNISDLTGLSLLDFSNLNDNSSIVLNFNNISDISELAKLGLKNREIYLQNNNIDFSKACNSSALAELYRNGCTVYISDQYSDEICVDAGGNSWYVSETGYSYEACCTIPIHGISDLSKVSFSSDNTSVIYDIYSKIQDGKLWFYYSYGMNLGTANITVSYNGVAIDQFSYRIYNESAAPTVSVSSYNETDGFYVGFSYWANSYEYRKQGDTEWLTSQNSWFYIAEAGDYEFRTYYNGVYSDLTTLTLKTTEQNGLKLLLKNGGWDIYGFDSSKIPADLVIPETVDGYPVTSISWLSWCDGLESVSIPKTVTKITGLYGNSNLKSITVSSDNPVYYAKNGVLIEKATSKLIVCPAGISGEVSLPEGIKKIDSSAFGGCYNLTSITLPASLSSVTGNAFQGCQSLTEVKVAEGNPWYYSQDGVLYERYTKTLVSFPKTKTDSFTVPAGTLFIGESAFLLSSLSSITIPSSVISIKQNAFRSSSISSLNLSYGLISIANEAFYSNQALCEVVIPNSVLNIGYYVFYSCDNLEKVSIPSSVIAIRDQYCFPSDTVIYCTENSYAHTYAVQYGFSYVLGSFGTAGDIDGDGAVSATDLSLIKKLLLGFFSGESTACDVNGDGDTDIRDLIRLKKNLANAQSTETPEKGSSNNTGTSGDSTAVAQTVAALVNEERAKATG